MSYVVAVPEFVASAASDLSNIGSGLSAAHAAAAGPTTAVVAAAGDEVSAAIASLFSGHGQAFQAFGAQAAAFHSQFVQALSGAGGAYAAAEAANASPLQTLWQDVLGVINAPTDVVGAPVDRQRHQWGAGDRASRRAGRDFVGQRRQRRVGRGGAARRRGR